MKRNHDGAARHLQLSRIPGIDVRILPQCIPSHLSIEEVRKTQTYCLQTFLLDLSQQAGADVLGKSGIHLPLLSPLPSSPNPATKRAMAPPCRVFSASDLPHEIQLDQGRRRKMVAAEGSATRQIDLSACALLSMTQYDCQIDRPEINDSPVRCWPVQRWFRR